MKKILTPLLASVVLTGSALAADLPVRGAAPAPIHALPIATWSGFYLGVNAGYFTSTAATILPGFPASSGKAHPDGFRAGGLIGYRHQYANNLVIGVEVDGSLLNKGTKTYVFSGLPPFGYKIANQGWDASVRGTLGYALDNILLYATGGVAFTAIKGCGVTNVAIPVCVVPPPLETRYSGTRAGWTLGGGLEYAINNAWSIRGEYLYANYGAKTYFAPAFAGNFVQTKYETHSFRVGLNYRFGAPAAPVVAKY